MKKYLLVFFILIAILRINPQSGNIILNASNSLDSFYPLQIGNRWDYSGFYTDYQGYSETDSFTVAVINDTIMPNSKKYFVLNHQDFAGGKFVRVDTDYVYYYNDRDSTEIPFFKLNAQAGENWSTNFNFTSHIWLESIDTLNLFGALSIVRHYKLDGLILCYVALSDKFGLYSYNSPGEPPGSDHTSKTLFGGMINNLMFGAPLSVKYKDNNKNPAQFALYQNYPNPFNPTTMITYQIPKSGLVTIKVYDVLGRVVKNLVNQNQSEGSHEINFNASDLSGGIYFYQLKAENFISTKKMILLR